MIDPKLKRIMRRVFETREGQVALQVILTDLGFFDEPPRMEPGDVARRTYATRLLSYLGFTHPRYVGDSMKPQFVKALFDNLPLPPEERKKKNAKGV